MLVLTLRSKPYLDAVSSCVPNIEIQKSKTFTWENFVKLSSKKYKGNFQVNLS